MVNVDGNVNFLVRTFRSAASTEPPKRASLADDEEELRHDDVVYPNPCETSWISRCFFLWFAPLVEIGSQRRIQPRDMWRLPIEHRSERAYEELLALYKVNGSLLWSIVRCYWRYFLSSGVLAFGGAAFSVIHPLLLYVVVRIAMTAKSLDDTGIIVGLLACILCSRVVSAAFKQHSLQVLLIASAKAVGAIESLLFDRTINAMHASTMTNATASFLLHELGKIYHVLTIIHTPWAYVLSVSVSLYTLYYIIGDAFMISIISAVAAQVIALLLALWDTSSNGRWTETRAARIQVVSECVKTIQTIKLHAWENRLLGRIQALRESEVEACTQYLAVSVVPRSILAILPKVIMIFTFAGLTGSDHGLQEFDPASVFATITIVNRLHTTFRMFIAHVNDLSRSYIFLQQLETLLQQQVTENHKALTRKERAMTPAASPLIHNPQVMIHVGSAMVARSSDEPLLVSANLLVRKGELVVIHGIVGFGKSTFLRALLGDALQLNRRGTIEVKGRVAYCSQEPWLQTQSIRDNILFGQPYDEIKYLNVLHACCLLRDLEALPSGDKTIVGPKGLNISGGQKARICLARACYADADVYLLPQLAYHPRRVRPTQRLPGQRLPPTPSLPSPLHHELALTNFAGSVVEVKWRRVGSKQERFKPLNEVDQVFRPDVLQQYVSMCGSVWFLVPLFLAVILARASLVASDVWICMWSEQVAQLEEAGDKNVLKDTNESRQINVVVYAILIVAAAAMTFYGSVLTVVSCREAADSLFQRMIRGVLFAPMAFFYSRPIGEIINRFSGDVVRVDASMQEFVFQTASTLAGVVLPWLVLMILIPEMILALPAVMYLVYHNRYHLRVAMQLLRHSIASLSPCYNSIEEYVEGRRVIQAFGWSHVDRFRREHQRHLDHMLNMQYVSSLFQS